MLGDQSKCAGIPASETFACKFQITIIPYGIPCLLAGAIASPFLFPSPGSWIVGSCLILLALILYFLRRVLLNGMESRWQVELMGWILFGLPISVTTYSSYWNMAGSNVSIGFLFVLAAFGFVYSVSYFVLLAVGLAGLILVHYAATNQVDPGQMHLAVLAPVYAMITRFAILNLDNRLTKAKNDLQSKVVELEEETLRRQESERQLAQVKKMEGLGVLAAGIAHDFNNHLQSIHNLATILEQEHHSEKAEQIQKVAMDAALLCKHMLEYTGKKNDEHTYLDLTSLVQTLEHLLKTGLDDRLRLKVELAPGDLRICANAAGLQHCITQLILNAIEASPSGAGEILLRVFPAEETGDHVHWRVIGEPTTIEPAAVIEVRDSGSGMDSTTIERAFDPYFTTKPSRHGMGLSSTLGITRSYGGIVRCHSRLGEGTIVQLILPLAQEPVSNSTNIRLPAALPVTGRNLLLVDDDPIVLRSLESLLKANGWQVTTAQSGHFALDLVLKASMAFDILLVDYSMPEMTGLGLLQRLRAANQDVPFILCSGYAEESIFNQGSVSPNAFLTKPFSMEQLREALASLSKPSIA